MTVPAADIDHKRKLGPVLATFLVAGNMIGSGVYLLPVTLGSVGSVSILGWVVAAGGALLLGAVFSYLALARPTANGVVAYSGEALGRFFGWEAAFAYWLTCVVGNIAIGLAAVGYLAHFLPVLKQPIWTAAGTAALIWLFTFANIIGPRLVGRFHGLALAVGLLPILAAAILGWFWFDPAVFAASWNVTEPPRSDASAIGLSLVMVFWAFLGLESASVCAGVVRNPERNVPIATFAGVLLAAVIYIAASAAVMGVLSAAELKASTAPFADVVARVAGPAAAAFVAGCAVLKASGTLGGWILVTAETTRASAESGFFPKWASRQRADGVPVRDLVVLAVLMTLVAFLTVQPTIGGQFTVLTNVATNLALAVYALCCLALLRFASALKRGKAAARVAAVLGFAFSVWSIVASDPELLQVQGWLFLISLPLFALVWWAGRARPSPAPAE